MSKVMTIAVFTNRFHFQQDRRFTMVNGIPQMQAMFRRKARKAMLAAREAAAQGGDEVASSMRYLAPREQGELVASIRVEQAVTVSSASGSRGFIGVLVKAGDSTTVVTNKNGFQFQNAKIQEFGTQNDQPHLSGPF